MGRPPQLALLMGNDHAGRVCSVRPGRSRPAEKNPPEASRAGLIRVIANALYIKSSGFNHIRSLQSFFTLHDVELNLLTFDEGFEAVFLNGGEMNEYILRAVFRFNESKAFVLIKPLHCTSGHTFMHPSFTKRSRAALLSGKIYCNKLHLSISN